MAAGGIEFLVLAGRLQVAVAIDFIIGRRIPGARGTSHHASPIAAHLLHLLLLLAHHRLFHLIGIAAAAAGRRGRRYFPRRVRGILGREIELSQRVVLLQRPNEGPAILPAQFEGIDAAYWAIGLIEALAHQDGVLLQLFLVPGNAVDKPIVLALRPYPC